MLSLVTDHHQAFLKANGILIKVSVKAWHKDFDLELLPDIAMMDFPPKPHVDRVTTAQEMIQVSIAHLIVLKFLKVLFLKQNILTTVGAIIPNKFGFWMVNGIRIWNGVQI